MAVKFLNGIDVDGSMNIVASDVPNLDASKITSGTFSTDRIPNLSGTYQPVGNYLTSIPSEYLTQTEGDARYLQSLPSHNHNTLYDAIGSADAVGQALTDRIDTEVFDAITSAQATADAALPKSGGTLYKQTNTTGTSGTTFLTVHNNVGGDISQQQSFVDFMFTDTNANFTPQVRIGAQVGRNADANAISKEGAGAFVVYTGDGTDESGNGALSEAMRIGFDNKLYVQGEIQASGYNKTNWDTAYGWGNHASAGYLTSIPSTYATDAEVSTAVGAVDARIDNEVFPAINDLGNAIPTNNNQLTNGAGYITSADGGNAGTLDGIDSTGFVKQLGDTNSPNYFTPSSRRVDPNATNPTNAHYAITTFGNGGNVTGQLATHFQTGKLYSRGYNTSWSAWQTYATESYVNAAVSNLVDSAPGALNTLNELAAALGDDANFSTTVTNNIGAVNTRIDEEVLPLIGSITLSNLNGLAVDGKAADSNLLDGINSTSFLRSDQADTMSGTLTITGSNGVSRLRIEGTTPTIDLDDSDGDSFYIHVNSNNFYVLTDRDGGGDYGTWEGPHPMQLEADTNSAYFFGNKLNSAAYQASSAFDAAGSADAVQTWVGEQNFATDAAINTAIATVTLASLGYTGATNANYITNNNQLTNGAGYITSIPSTYATDAEVSTAVATVDTRIDNEVFPAINDLGNAIPTNNNQLTNGAGYITDGNTNWNNSYGFITEASYIKAGGAGPSTENLNTVANSVVTGELEYRGFNLASSNRPPASDNANGVITVGQHSGNYNAQLAFSSDGNMYWRDNPSTSFGDWRTVWDSGNLDAFVGATVSNDTITFTKANGGTVAVTTSDANTWRPIDDTPVNGVTTESISSNWAYDHVNASNPHGTTAADVGADPAGSAAAVDSRIDTDVLPAIPTNNNQLTNGAGYITAVPSSFSTNSITIGGGVTLSESTDRADLLMIKSSTSTWGGLQISNTSNEIIFSMMGDGTTGGIYDDQNSDWLIQWTENAGVRLYHNAGQKLTTTSTGVSITGALVASGDVTAFSDARVKENVETLPNALESVKQMRGVTYNKIGEEKQSVGVIAQELEEVVPQLVHTDEDGMKSVAYGNITAVLIEALKEQQAQIEELKSRLDGLTK